MKKYKQFKIDQSREFSDELESKAIFKLRFNLFKSLEKELAMKDRQLWILLFREIWADYMGLPI